MKRVAKKLNSNPSDLKKSSWINVNEIIIDYIDYLLIKNSSNQSLI